MKRFVFLFLSLGIFCSLALGQNNASIWTVDAIKTNDGEQANFLESIEQNWAKARQTIKEKGFIKSFRVFSVKPDKSQSWDVMLLTEYTNRKAFEKREEIFAEVFKAQPLILVNGKRPRDMAKIISLDLGYDQPISSETLMSGKTENDSAQIPLQNYLQAQAIGNGDLIRQAFYKDARIMAFRDGKWTNLSVEEFAGRFTGKPADDEAKRKRSIESIEVSGTAAIAKIVLDYPTVKFTDYMTLLKIDDEWKIVNKSFFAEPRENPAEKINSKSGVEATLNAFIQGSKSGNSELLRHALHSEGNQKYVENNKYSSKTYPDFLAQFEKVRKGKPHPDDKDRKRTIENIEITGNVAVAKLIADYPDFRYFEYIALLKTGDEWKIVNSVFSGEPKPPKQK